ncbi:hypothetical protein AMTRI_Chr01g112760 [Amborella trichopoda]|nr:polygalacturonase 1 beta-like protein 3 isoform X2 [Amborella trichopoda]XP_020523270.1 polygalacturonase 1 beta-like protein 3 isoform X2 [Amborella trichopoda]|eukprot:XP_020523269.1 polygalacturonase 1 beta-like protein 3 isoform X2 [Amborella trichopoda]
MEKQKRKQSSSPPIVFFLLILSSSLVPALSTTSISPNPLSPRASVKRYWQSLLPNSPIPHFLLDKSSPLDHLHTAIFSNFIDKNSLSSHLSSFCQTAHLFCFPRQSLASHGRTDNFDFKKYTERNFSDYGTGAVGGTGGSFKNYSDSENVVAQTFVRYSRDATGHGDSFAHYSPDTNVFDGSFSGYGSGSVGKSSEFVNYAGDANVPELRFNVYSSDSTGREQRFASYSDNANAGDQGFKSYGKRGNGVPSSFTSYGKDSNVMGSTFVAYGESGNGANDSFVSYAESGNVPQNNFRSYGDSGNGAIESFIKYRDSANVGDDTFQSYGKGSNSGSASFSNYGKSFNEGSDLFKGYGEGANAQTVNFKGYAGDNTTFKDYVKKSATITFSQYTNSTPSESSAGSPQTSKWAVEPGKFFRQKLLTRGAILPMPDIRDSMPSRSFLPRSIAEKLPFSTESLPRLAAVFSTVEDSGMGKVLRKTLKECEREPSKGERRKCVTSIEGMMDFAVSILGKKASLKATESVNGWGREVELGEVRDLNVTEAVSCHQSLFPYLVYYCHAVPVVRVYEAEILEKREKVGEGSERKLGKVVKREKVGEGRERKLGKVVKREKVGLGEGSERKLGNVVKREKVGLGKREKEGGKKRERINKGVAICHLNTKEWGPNHGAFIALGPGPGKIEVCHWIFENDMIWVPSN